MAVELIEMDELVSKYAEDFLDSDQRKHADLNNPIIDYDKMYVLYDDTEYTQPHKPPIPQSHILFTANFANNTPKPQTYALRTERRTRSTTTICFMKTFSYGGGIQMKLTPPNPVIEASAGFHADMTKTKGVTQTFERGLAWSVDIRQPGVSQTFEQELAWSVDNQVSVPPGYQTKAELIIKEDEFDGDFQVNTIFGGKIKVTYENKKNQEHVATVLDNVTRFLAKQERFGFKKDEQGRITFLVKGTCKSRYGLSQYVKLTESVLPAEEDSKEEQ